MSVASSDLSDDLISILQIERSSLKVGNSEGALLSNVDGSAGAAIHKLECVGRVTNSDLVVQVSVGALASSGRRPRDSDISIVVGHGSLDASGCCGSRTVDSSCSGGSSRCAEGVLALHKDLEVVAGAASETVVLRPVVVVDQVGGGAGEDTTLRADVNILTEALRLTLDDENVVVVLVVAKLVVEVLPANKNSVSILVLLSGH